MTDEAFEATDSSPWWGERVARRNCELLSNYKKTSYLSSAKRRFSYRAEVSCSKLRGAGSSTTLRLARRCSVPDSQDFILGGVSLGVSVSKGIIADKPQSRPPVIAACRTCQDPVRSPAPTLTIFSYYRKPFSLLPRWAHVSKAPQTY